MGHGADPSRPALGLGRALLLIAAMVMACGPPPSTDPGASNVLRIFAITGLRADDPILAGLPDSVTRSEDTIASGTGAGAVLELLDGRSALDHLRAPGDPLAWAHARGWATRIDVMDTALRSTPEWVHAGATWQFAERWPGDAQVDLHMVVASRDQIDDEALLALLQLSGRSPVVVAGIPPAPQPRDDAETIVENFRVPVLTKGRPLAQANARTLADVLAPLRGEVRRPAPRTAHWWESQGGGVLVERPGAWVVGGSGRVPVAVGSLETLDPERVLEAATGRGALLVLIRGSEAADLTSLELLTSSEPAWSAWGLEPIDSVQHPSRRYLQLDLAAEPEGDGILIENAQSQVIDIRLGSRLEDAPTLGTPVRDAASGRWIGLDTFRFSPYSRDYWRLSRRTGFDTGAWWSRAGAGLDLLWVREGTAPPAPVLFED